MLSNDDNEDDGLRNTNNKDFTLKKGIKDFWSRITYQTLLMIWVSWLSMLIL